MVCEKKEEVSQIHSPNRRIHNALLSTGCHKTSLKVADISVASPEQQRERIPYQSPPLLLQKWKQDSQHLSLHVMVVHCKIRPKRCHDVIQTGNPSICNIEPLHHFIHSMLYCLLCDRLLHG